MNHKATLTFSESLVRQAVLRFWLRSVGLGFFVALAVAIFCLAFLVAQGDRSWVVGGMGAVILIGIAIAIGIYFSHYRNSIRKFRGMESPTATVVVDDATLTLASGVATSTIGWSAVKEVWKFQGFWLLLFSKAQFATLPLTSISPEMQDFILRRVQEQGGKIA